MALLDWINKRNQIQTDTPSQTNGWRSVGAYLYNSDGRYPAASWAETPEQFAGMVPQICNHLDNKLEVRITNSEDHLLFHATKNGIEWDGIRLSEYLSREQQANKAISEIEPERMARDKDRGMER
jgi:hypothetical protein